MHVNKFGALLALTVGASVGYAQFTPLHWLNTADPVLSGSPGEFMVGLPGARYHNGQVYVSARSVVSGLPSSFIAQAVNRQAHVVVNSSASLPGAGSSTDLSLEVQAVGSGGSLLFTARPPGPRGLWRQDGSTTSLVYTNGMPVDGMPGHTLSDVIRADLLPDGRHAITSNVINPNGIPARGVFTGTPGNLQPRLVTGTPVPGNPTATYSHNFEAWRPDALGRAYAGTYAGAPGAPVGSVWRIDESGDPVPVVIGNEAVIGVPGQHLDLNGNEHIHGAASASGTPFLFGRISDGRVGVFGVSGGQATPLLLNGDALPAFGPNASYRGNSVSDLYASNSGHVAMASRVRFEMAGGTFRTEDAFFRLTAAGALPIVVDGEAEPLVPGGWTHGDLGRVVMNDDGWAAFSSALFRPNPNNLVEALFATSPDGTRHLLLDGASPFEVDPGVFKTLSMINFMSIDDDGTILAGVSWTDQSSSILTFTIPAPGTAGALAAMGLLCLRRRRPW